MEKTTRRLPIVERDEWLQPVEAQMNLRHERYERKMADIGPVSYTHLTLPTSDLV